MLSKIIPEANRKGAFSLKRKLKRNIILSSRSDDTDIGSLTEEIISAEERLEDLIFRDSQSGIHRTLKDVGDKILWLFGAEMMDHYELFDYAILKTKELANEVSGLYAKGNQVIKLLDSSRKTFLNTAEHRVKKHKEFKNQYSSRLDELERQKLLLEDAVPAEQHYFSQRVRLIDLESEAQSSMMSMDRNARHLKDVCTSEEAIGRQRQVLWFRQVYLASVIDSANSMHDYLRAMEPGYKLFIEQQKVFQDLPFATGGLQNIIGLMHDLVLGGASNAVKLIETPEKASSIIGRFSSRAGDVLSQNRVDCSQASSKLRNDVDNYITTGNWK